MGVEVISTLNLPRQMTSGLLLHTPLIAFSLRIKIISPIVNDQHAYSRLHYK